MFSLHVEETGVGLVVLDLAEQLAASQPVSLINEKWYLGKVDNQLNFKLKTGAERLKLRWIGILGFWRIFKFEENSKLILKRF